MTIPNQSDMQARQMAMTEYESSRKKGVIAWLLWLFLGTLGAHRFYLGHTGYAIAMLFLAWATFGLWTLIDAFFINRNLRRINSDKWMNVAARYGASAYPMPESAQ